MLNKKVLIGASVFYVAYWLYILFASIYGFGSVWEGSSKSIFAKCVVGLLKMFSCFPSDSLTINSFAWAITFYLVLIIITKVKQFIVQ